MFVISAQQMPIEDAERLMRAAPRYGIHGKEFSKGVYHEKRPEGTEWGVMYLTVSSVYLLEFNIQSLDLSMAQDLERCVEEITFFDPAKAREIAGANAKPYNPTSSHSKN